MASIAIGTVKKYGDVRNAACPLEFMQVKQQVLCASHCECRNDNGAAACDRSTNNSADLFCGIFRTVPTVTISRLKDDVVCLLQMSW